MYTQPVIQKQTPYFRNGELDKSETFCKAVFSKNDTKRVQHCSLLHVNDKPIF